MVERLAAVAVSLGPHRSMPSAIGKSIGRRESRSCRERQLDRFVSLPPSPQESAPAAQQEPASSSSGPAAPMPTQNFQNEQIDSPMELGPQERGERKGARPSETPTSEISGRPVVKARPASPPMIVPTAEGSVTGVLTTPASSSKDEMTIGGLYVIDGIDVVATLVPEEDVWQFEATETCTTETLMQDGEQESIAVVDNEDPSAMEAIEAHHARTSEKLVSEEVRKGRAKEVRELDDFEVKMEVDESEMRSTPSKKIWSKWVETRNVQTVQQYDVDCVPRKRIRANRDLTRLRQPHL